MFIPGGVIDYFLVVAYSRGYTAIKIKEMKNGVVSIVSGIPKYAIRQIMREIREKDAAYQDKDQLSFNFMKG